MTRLLLLLPLLVACAGAVEREVLVEVEDYYRDLSARDWEAFADHFWPGATISYRWTPPGESEPRVEVVTVPDWVAAAPEGVGSQPIFAEWMTGAEVRVAGRLATVWADYAARFGNEEQVMEWTGVDAMTLLRHDGRWRLVSLAYDAGD